MFCVWVSFYLHFVINYPINCKRLKFQSFLVIIICTQPPNTPKRPAAGEEDDEDEWESTKKPKRVIKTPYHARQRQIKEVEVATPRDSEPATPVRAALPSSTQEVVEPQLTEKEKEDILKYVETEAPEVEALDEATLKRMILLFEKRALRNQEMRVKFPDQPEKYIEVSVLISLDGNPFSLSLSLMYNLIFFIYFHRFMESEVELHETLQELHIIAANPDLYQLMVELGAVPSLLELLSHENTDIAVGVVDLLQELTDVDILHESQEGADTLIDALLEQQVCALLVQNLERLDEAVKEESDGVYNTLGKCIDEHIDELDEHMNIIYYLLSLKMIEGILY